MKKLIALFVILSLLSVFTAAQAETADLPVIRISVEGIGDIYAELYPETAPITVENFLGLIDSGFYNGLTFHRIISGFMVQGGDPLGNGTGGSEQKIRGEFSANGVENPLAHTRGVLSMARSGEPDSASSQFFIMHADTSSLDGNYAAFGKVLAGMDVVDALCRDTPVTDNNGTVPAADQPVMREVARATRAEAEEAMAREEENGRNGAYADSTRGISFPVPEGWSRQLSSNGSLVFSHEESGAIIQIAAQDLWRYFGAEFRTSMETEGKARENLDTSYFGDQITRIVSGADSLEFTETEYSGTAFYSAETETDGTPVWLRVGAANGRLICFIGIGEGAGEAMDQMMAQLAVQ